MKIFNNWSNIQLLVANRLKNCYECQKDVYFTILDLFLMQWVELVKNRKICMMFGKNIWSSISREPINQSSRNFLRKH